ncbi:hypothetical protein GGS26DRAFT_350215 [Hypomontagnella submonticulosa]|nr:hypothetical protein GGS26DRAFT_350215 [Hypomontagnella submonticulosa]
MLLHEASDTYPSAGHNDLSLETTHPALHQNALASSRPPLITYAYTESPCARENLMFFLSNGLHSNADFIFILNGATNMAKLIPNKTNIQVVSRPNDCFTPGAHSEILREDSLWKNYNYFITLDSSIRGPFMPYWSRNCWSDVFLGRLTKDVKLVGMTASCSPKFHIQPMIWATDAIGMELLLNPPKAPTLGARHDDSQVVAFRGCYSNQKQATHGEVEATAVIKKAGYKVDALMATFHGSNDYEEDCANPPIEDILQSKKHGISLHPYETIFIKAGDGIDSVSVSQFTEWHQSSSVSSSWDRCG